MLGSYKYKFGGKEQQTEFDINTYDFGARNYDPALGRWMNIDPLAEYAFTHSPYHYAYNNPIYYIDPDGMMGIPMAVTSLGMGIDGVKDIGGGGGGGELGGGKEPDPQYPNTSGVQELDEVVVVAKKKDKGTDDGTPVWGMDTENRGTKEGTRRGDIDMREMPGGPGGARPTPNKLMNFLRDLLDVLDWGSRTKKVIESNESTMETNNEEPVDPPVQEPQLFFIESFSRGQKVGVDRAYTKTSAVKVAKTGANKSNIDSTRVSPFFGRGIQGNEIRKAKDTIIK